MIVRPVYRTMSWGLTGLRSPSNELRSEGNIQHSCAYSEGRGQERRAATLSGTGAGLASEAVFTEPVCIYKNVCLNTKIKISPMARDGNVKRESELDGDKRYFFF